MATSLTSKLGQILLPKKTPSPQGVANSPTFQSNSSANVLTVPTYRDHLTDIFTTRSADDANTLLQSLLVQDPDASASVNAYLTTADTEPVIYVKDVNDKIDRNGQKTLNAILDTLTTRYDYVTVGFQYKPTLRAMAEELRYMLLLRGMLVGEAIISKEGIFDAIRLIDPISLKWFEKTNGRLTPEQVPTGGGNNISLDVVSVFAAYYRQDPTKAYSNSPFVSSINTVAARQRIINDLYRIMTLTGYPRLDITVLEEVIANNAPLDIKADPAKFTQYVNNTITSITNTVTNLRADQAFVHTDSIKADMVNTKSAGMTLDIEPIVKTLNAQNQAALRVMATTLGRGESGVNTASVEAALFAKNAEALNTPIAELWEQIFTFVLRLTGSTSRVVVKFRPVELRPATELEAQLTLRQARLQKDLSLGVIDDDEYHLEMYGRIRPDSAPLLSGTGFADAGSVVDAGGISPNNDPTGRSVSSAADKSVKSNAVKK
jgi:hypothetical protein